MEPLDTGPLMTEAEVYKKYPDLAPTQEEAEHEQFLENLDLDSEEGIQAAINAFEFFFNNDETEFLHALFEKL